MRDLKNVKRVIIKIGSSSLVKQDLSINYEVIDSIMYHFYELKQKGIDTALVTSGAIAVGMNSLGLKKKPKDMPLKQACAAVGQAKLMDAYNIAAARYNLLAGQILVSHDDFEERNRMLNLSNTFEAMFKNNIIPIINENDALSVEEIKVGDNDTLSSLIATMIDGDLLILFSDIDGLFDKNPKLYDDAKMIDTVTTINDEIFSYAGLATSNVGTGGMATKINAAVISTASGCAMIICNSTRINDLTRIVLGENVGTLFMPQANAISAKDNWLAFKTKSVGSIIVDNGVKDILKNKKVSILPKGVIGVKNTFYPGSIIDVRDVNNKLIAKGTVNYSSKDIKKMMGKSSKEIECIIEDYNKVELIHADNLVLIKEDAYGKAIK